MPDRTKDLRDCLTAYDCRDRLPDLASWMDDDLLKQITIWKGTRFAADSARPVPPGATVIVDDDLVLYFTKILRA